MALANVIAPPELATEWGATPVAIGVLGNKTVYRKVCTVGAISTPSALNLVDTSFYGKTILDITGCVLQTDGSYVPVNDYYDNNNHCCVFITSNDGYLYFTGTNAVASGYIVVIYAE